LNVPWIADLRDPWALDETIVYPTMLNRKFELAKMKRSLSSAALIIMNTPQAVTDLKRTFPVLGNKKVIAITNGYDSDDFADEITSRTDSRFRIVHSGLMLTSTGLQLRERKFYRVLGGAEPGVDIITRSPEFLLKAVDAWQSRQPDIRKDVELWFAGNASQDDRLCFGSSRASNLIRSIGHIPHRESLQLIRTADLLFLPMHNLPPGRRCRSVPGKAYEYMASGRPILAAVPDGDARDFLVQCGTAFICRPDDVEGMIRILSEVYDAWKRGIPSIRQNSAFLENFTRRNITHKLAASLRSVLHQEVVRTDELDRHAT
jgi:glycosyltransferase involved in cell wall biosynthesis